MSEWISVEDDLPDMAYIPVLVAVCSKLSGNQVNIAMLDRHGNFEVLDCAGNHADFITHWKPLPEPPNGDNK